MCGVCFFKKSIPRQPEDKVFRLRQSKRNAGRFVDLAASGVYTGVLKKSLDFLGFTGTSSGESGEKQ